MKCPKCKAENPEEQEFCGKCVAKLDAIVNNVTKNKDEKMIELCQKEWSNSEWVIANLEENSMPELHEKIKSKSSEQPSILSNQNSTNIPTTNSYFCSCGPVFGVDTDTMTNAPTVIPPSNKVQVDVHLDEAVLRALKKEPFILLTYLYHCFAMIKLRTIVFHTVFIFLLQFIGGFVTVLLERAFNLEISLPINIGISRSLYIVGFCISGSILKSQRFRKLVLIALSVWCLDFIPEVMFNRDIVMWLLFLPFILIYMLIGGTISLVLVRLTKWIKRTMKPNQVQRVC
ncbi:hypothetical protein ACFL02_08880 [Planctomycetota bacterium]